MPARYAGREIALGGSGWTVRDECLRNTFLTRMCWEDSLPGLSGWSFLWQFLPLRAGRRYNNNIFEQVSLPYMSLVLFAVTPSKTKLDNNRDSRPCFYFLAVLAYVCLVFYSMFLIFVWFISTISLLYISYDQMFQKRFNSIQFNISHLTTQHYFDLMNNLCK